MLKKSVLLLVLITTLIGCEDDLKFRFDYTFNEDADGWMKFNRVPDKWNVAKNKCQIEGAVLASPLTIQRKKSILKFVSNESIPQIFTGVHATFSQGDYASVEGLELPWLPITWAPGEPDNKDNSERCLAMMTQDGTMADVNCDEPLPYVCFKKRTELTLNECGTIDKAYKLDARTGHCYKFNPRGLSWPKAYSVCASEGAYLAIMNSDEESKVLRELYGKFRDDELLVRNVGAAHVGVRDMRDGGSWMTIHGQTMVESGFARWGGGQPDNATSKSNPEGELCGSIFKDGRYNDVWCALSLAFICEKEPSSLE